MRGRKPRPGLRSTYKDREGRNRDRSGRDLPSLVVLSLGRSPTRRPHAIRAVDSASAYTDSANPITISVEVFRLESPAD
jgi:hypothetical protein